MTEDESLDQIRARLLTEAKQEIAFEAARLRDEILAEARLNAENEAKELLRTAIERCHVPYVTEATTALIALPSEDVKGRIIGREGRNIRAFEQVAGVDLIVDETPEAILISSFDPVRREIARLSLMNLIIDGRIHPARIEELHAAATAEIDRVIAIAGIDAAQRADVRTLPTAVLDQLGKLRFRVSFAQNILDHSVEVAHLAALLAGELGLDADIARQAGLLHDIGKGLDETWPGPHAIAGMNFLASHGIAEPVMNAVGAHHQEIPFTAPESSVVMVADSISASRPGARRESVEHYAKRLAVLEKIANRFDGVEKSYAVQSGRAVRVIVRPGELDDEQARVLAKEITAAIQREVPHTGPIKITVIRETRIEETTQ